MTTKTCRHCGQHLTLDCFHCNRRAKDRRQSYCKECQRHIHRRWQADNRIHIRYRPRTGRTWSPCTNQDLCP